LFINLLTSAAPRARLRSQGFG